MREWIVGRNPVYEVLRAERRRVYRLQVNENAVEKGRIAEILHITQVNGITTEYVSKQVLQNRGINNQGLALEVGEFPYSGLPELLELAENRKEPPFLLILDALQDPQNLGTLLRTAEAVGVHGVLLPLRQTATITPAVVNASSGACEHLLVCQINLSQAIRQIKQAGVWVIGLDAGEDVERIDRVRLDGPIAVVVGSEGQGMRALVRNSCDGVMRLPMRGKVESLNAAVAGSIALYLIWQMRSYQGGELGS